MSLAQLRQRPDYLQAKELIAKAKKPAKEKIPAMKAGNSYISRIQAICEQVQARLGKYADKFELITDEAKLESYITHAIENNIIAIDTETTGLDPICDELVGVCIYTYNEKPAYIPVNHISYVTNLRLNNQLTNEQVANQLKRLVEANTQNIFFNAKFDIRVIRHQLGINLEPAWDGFIAAKVLKEDEPEHNLKFLWKKYCSDNKEAEHFTFDKMFEGLIFNIIPTSTAYLYAANDAIMTMELYDFQKHYLTENDELCKSCGFEKLAKLYREIELPIISLTATIEDTGIAIDLDYCHELSVKYHKLLDEKLDAFYKGLSEYQDQLSAYLATNPNSKIQTPLNVSSPVQLAELFYDVLKLPSVSKKQPRGTGEEILIKLGHPLSKLILDYREVNKLITTYIDKMPEIVNKKTGKIHCNFGQIGTACVTGDTLLRCVQHPNWTIQQVIEHYYPDMQLNVFYPLNITIVNKNGELENTSHCIKFANEPTIKLTFSDNSTIEGTYNHPIMCNGVFKELQYISINDQVDTLDGQLTVVNIEQSINDVYDLTVPNTHSFATNNVISHNTGRYSCIAAGTKISMPKGDTAIEDVKVGDYVYCYNDNGKLELKRVTASMFTGNRKCIKLKWYSKYNHRLKGELICTPEHLVKTLEGWKQAKDLTEKDTIFHVHRQEHCGKAVRLNGQFSQGNEEEHVWIKKEFFKTKDSSLHIHHIDKNRYNNDPSNLIVCTAKEHAKLHRQKKDGYCRAYDFTYEQVYNIGESVNWDIFATKYDHESLVSWFKEYKINYIEKYTQNYNKRRSWFKNGKLTKVKRLPLVKSNCKYALELANFDFDLAASYFQVQKEQFVSACEKYKLLNNHKVYKIEDCSQIYSVYDLEVEDNHNFIANELCVHNSSNPNMQNIPSHNKDIRQMFIAPLEAKVKLENKTLELLYNDLINTKEGKIKVQNIKINDILIDDNNKEFIVDNISIDDVFYSFTVNSLNEKAIFTVAREYVLIGSDYSQQEPKLTAHMSNDERFINDCASGKDAYATIASIAFNKPYEDCLEFYLDENGEKTTNVNKEGKERRGHAKIILLGVCYGKTMKSIAEDLQVSEEKAQEIYDAIMTRIPGLKHFMEESQEMARQLGYVETNWGRRRHIPDMQLKPYEITSTGNKNFDPFFDSMELGVIDESEQLRQHYYDELVKAKYKQQKDKIKAQAEKDGFKIKENTKKIEDATRQCVNSRIQGSAADQTKIAMRIIKEDKNLQKYQFQIVLLVHDEIIGQCPRVTAKKAIPEFTNCMISAAKDIRTGAKCDASIVKRWYGKEIDIEEL